MAERAPPDDPSIDSDDILYRRVKDDQVKWNSSGKAERAGKNAFRDSSDGTHCSVDLHSVLTDRCLDVRTVIEGYPDCGIVGLRVGDARDLGFGVVRDPQPQSPAHAFLTGSKEKLSRQRKLAGRTAIVIEPPRP